MAEAPINILDEIVAAISSHDVEKLVSLYTEDCFYEDVAQGGTMRGREALKASYNEIFVRLL